MHQGPLAGVRVLELGHIIAVPYSGMHLADLGADVVKVETPAGDGARMMGWFAPNEGTWFHGVNRGKRSTVVDMRKPEGLQAIYRMVPSFDVVTINARPGVPQRIGVDYETLRQYREDLIYLENTAFGRTGPGAQRAGTDGLAQAYSGLMVAEGKTDVYGAPTPATATALADRAAGLAGAMGVVAALYHRQRTGQGQYVETSLLGSALSLQDGLVMRLPLADSVYRDPTMARVNEARANGATYDQLLRARSSSPAMAGSPTRAYYCGYHTKDGAIFLGGLTRPAREDIRAYFGITDDHSDAPDFDALDPANAALYGPLHDRIQAIIRQKSSDEWIAEFDAAGIQASKVQFPEDMADDPQVAALDLMVTVEHPTLGEERMVGPVVRMSETPPGVVRSSPPLGHHTHEVLSELGFSDSEIAELSASGALG